MYNDIEKYIKIDMTDEIVVALERNVEYTVNDLFSLVFSQIKKILRENAIKEYLRILSLYNPSNALYVLTKFEKGLTNPNSHYICFYTDIIEPSIINGQKSRILLIKPKTILNKSEITISTIQYQSLEKFRINDTSTLIADEHGAQINFEESTHSTCIVLHFF